MSTFFRQVSGYFWLQFQPRTTPRDQLSYFAAAPGRFRARCPGSLWTGIAKFRVPAANFAALVSVFSRAFLVRDDEAMMDEATIDEAVIDEQGWTGGGQSAKV
jgi:hypothetical protein